MSEWEDIIEERIQAAMKAGAFDDLPGKGKPLKLDDNPFEDSAAWTAHHLLRANGYTLPWIDQRHEIEDGVQKARDTLTRSYSWARDGLARTPPDTWTVSRWRQAVETFRRQAATLNHRIRDYNLKVPNAAFQIAPLNVAQEIERPARE